MQEKSNSFSIDDAMRLAKSPAGQQLMALLQQQPKEQLSKAADQAAAGDIQNAMHTLNALLSSQEAKSLLQQLGGQSNE